MCINDLGPWGIEACAVGFRDQASVFMTVVLSSTRKPQHLCRFMAFLACAEELSSLSWAAVRFLQSLQMHLGVVLPNPELAPDLYSLKPKQLHDPACLPGSERTREPCFAGGTVDLKAT